MPTRAFGRVRHVDLDLELLWRVSEAPSVAAG